MTITNIIDRRKNNYRFLKVNAIIEPTWHDNYAAAKENGDTIHPSSDESLFYQQKEHTSVAEAISWANDLAKKHSENVTLFLYDEDDGI